MCHQWAVRRGSSRCRAPLVARARRGTEAASCHRQRSKPGDSCEWGGKTGTQQGKEQTPKRLKQVWAGSLASQKSSLAAGQAQGYSQVISNKCICATQCCRFQLQRARLRAFVATRQPGAGTSCCLNSDLGWAPHTQLVGHEMFNILRLCCACQRQQQQSYRSTKERSQAGHAVLGGVARSRGQAECTVAPRSAATGS